MLRTQLFILHRLAIKRRAGAIAAAIVALVMLAGVRPAAAADQAFERALHSSVAIFNAQSELGCGVCIDARQGLIVTAGHVVGDNATVSIYSVVYGADGRPIHAFSFYMSHKELSVVGYVIRRDRSRDLAIVRLGSIPAGLQAVPMAAEDPQMSDAVFAIGNSGTDDDDTMWNYRDGRVRSVCHKEIHTAEGFLNANMIETTIASNHGDSGGPVLNSRGELVAVTITHHPDGKVDDPGQLIGFCTDVTEIRALLRELHLTVNASASPLPLNLVPSAAVTPAPVFAPVPPVAPAPELVAIPDLPPVAPAAAAPSARIVGVNFSDDAAGPMHFIAVRSNVIVSGAKGVDCEVVCTACDENHKPLRDVITGKPLQITQDIRPGYDTSDYFDSNALEMNFLPALIQLYTGNRPFGFMISVRIKATGQWITPRACIVMCPTALQQMLMPQAMTPQAPRY